MMTRLINTAFIILFTSAAIAANPNINTIVDRIATTSIGNINGEKIINKNLIMKIYNQNNNNFLWPVDYLNEGIEVIRDSNQDGLLKRDYHYYALVELMRRYNQSSKRNNQLRAEIDILLTDGILTYQHHLLNGKVPPKLLYKYWNYNHVNVQSPAIIARLRKSIQQRSLKSSINAARPHYAGYRKLQIELRRYKKLAAEYPDSTITLQGQLTLGQRSNSIPAIAKKLEQIGLIRKTQRHESTLYSQDLIEPIKQYQRLHGLGADAVIGQKTINNMNAPYSERVNQIKANLERARWIADDLSSNYILINIAGFKLFYYQNHQYVWDTEVIVGKQANKTPVFSAKMKYIDFYPTWTVPKSMAVPIVKKAQTNPGYLSSRGFLVKTESGRILSTNDIDWRSQNPYNFNYWLVQKPGPHNPMGKVKFMLPNPHAIYLHDTPTKKLFSRSSRPFSKGCIRVNHPFDLSLKILEHDQGFTEYQQAQILYEEHPETVYLKRPLDVFIMYWTASPEPDGFYFYEDIYHRDPELIKLLNTPFDRLLDNKNKHI